MSNWGLARYLFIADRNNAAVASSTTLRSALNRAVMSVLTVGRLVASEAFFSSLSIHSPGTTVLTPPPTARMAAWGGLITAENSAMPNMPRLEMQKVPPWYSSGASFPSRARVAKSFTEADISDRPSIEVCGTMGVIRPVGVATATEMSTVSWMLTVLVLALYVALTSGTSRRASAALRMTKSLTLTLTSWLAASCFRRARAASSSIWTVV
mmetsp:Transcript_31972/g.94043  ORF Transcript_31972/g.94043 Transcript_31972/m.94043 type:complete len:211 (+) Transcript_31972:52-684(+)